MAKIPKSGRRFEPASAAAPIDAVTLADFAAACTKRYGTMTIEDRALPDFRDGVKPVHRRTLYAMYKLGLHYRSSPKKSARVVGDVIGKYHPHGDASSYDAMVTIANTPTRLIDGQGNWGWWKSTDLAAAQRYTEARLTEYADLGMLDPYYLRVVPMIANFDGEEMEPLFLPALLPTGLLIGAQGIAVAVTTNIPAYQAKGLAELVKVALRGQKITPQMCVSRLKFQWSYGGSCISRTAALMEYYKTGVGSLQFACDYEVDKHGRTIKITGPAPWWSFDRFYDKVSEFEGVLAVLDKSGKAGINITVNLKKNIFGDELDALIAKIENELTVSAGFRTNVTRRRLEKNGDVIEAGAEFQRSTIPDYLMDWTRWRVALEVRALKQHAQELAAKVNEQVLIRKAIDHLEIIFQVLRSKTDDADGLLATRMKISREDAKYILDLAARRLSNLNAAATDRKLAELRAEVKQIEGWLKNPAARVLETIDSVVARAERSRKLS